MKKQIDATFESRIERKVLKDGTHQISCKLGLWGVSGSKLAMAEREARHYWIQYFGDGEYNRLLGR